tara:strand:+ start:157 stop:912 length:756 start_codon:yes stop_codon:yes gene_type:complete
MVAKAFDKSHPNVIKSIERVMSQVSDSFGEVNFNATEYEQNNNLGILTKYKKYDLTKDGFMMVVMGFTGAKAVMIKEAYINAFTIMYKRLSVTPPPTVQNVLVELPTLTPAQKNHIQNEVRSLVNTQIGTTYSGMWRSIKDQLKVGTHKEIPANKYIELCEFLKCEPIEGELLLKQNYVALPLPAPGCAYLEDTKQRVSNLKHWALQNQHNAIVDDLDVIGRCLISSRTHAEESLMSLNTTINLLKRWRDS